MNTRRQTIWLVSMLSIMVVLSAYYLLTDSPNDFEAADGDFVLDETGLNTEEFAANVEELADSGLTDQELLDQMMVQATMGSGFFTNLQMQRDESMSKEYDRLMSIVTDTQQNNEATSAALQQLDQMEDLMLKLDYVEAELMKDYGNAIITEDGNKWKVIVQAESLEQSEVVSILDLVTKEMGIKSHQVTVQKKS